VFWVELALCGFVGLLCVVHVVDWLIRRLGKR
jgi:hypothetical protein